MAGLQEYFDGLLEGISKGVGIIKEELPKFASEMNLPFSADAETGVMQEKGSLEEKRILENLLSGAAMTLPYAGAAVMLPKVAAAVMPVAATALTKDPTNLIPGKAGLAMMEGVGDAEAAIRPGGNPSFNLVHNTGSSLEELRRWLSGARPVISTPSIAIARDNIFPFARTPTLLFNPNSELLDPAKAKTNQLFNRDAYTTRDRAANIEHRVYGHDVRFTEVDSTGAASHDMAIAASPSFKSFAEYERSIYGGKRLNPPEEAGSGEVTEMSEELNKAVDDYMEDALGYDISGMLGKTKLKMLEKQVKLGDEDAANLLTLIKAIPSDYAELKVMGNVPIDQRNISAIVFPEYSRAYDQHVIDEIRAARPDIPVGTPSQLLPQEYHELYAELAKSLKANIENSIKKVSASIPETAQIESYDMRKAYKELPQSVKQYVTENAFNRFAHIENVNRLGVDMFSDYNQKFVATAEEALINGIFENKGAADVASMLTSKKQEPARKLVAPKMLDFRNPAEYRAAKEKYDVQLRESAHTAFETEKGSKYYMLPDKILRDKHNGVTFEASNISFVDQETANKMLEAAEKYPDSKFRLEIHNGNNFLYKTDEGGDEYLLWLYAGERRPKVGLVPVEEHKGTPHVGHAITKLLK